MLEALFEACDKEDPNLIATELQKLEFSMVNIADSDSEEYDAMTADVEDFPALVGFTSIKHAEIFANEVDDALTDDGDLPVFSVSGETFLKNLPDFFGVLLNPESEDCMVFPPDLMMKIRSASQT